MANTVIQLKKSTIPGNVPSSLESGEIAINTADGILFYKDPSNVIKTIRTDTTTNAYSVLNVNSSLLIATSNSDILSVDSVGAITLTPDSINDKFTIGVKSGTVFEEGVVQLYDGVDSNSIILAATANSVNVAYNFANTSYTHAEAAFAKANTTSASGLLSSSLIVEEFTATQGQTVFNVTNGYVGDNVQVYVNGVLIDSSEYTATDSLTVVFDIGLNLDDEVTITKWALDANTALITYIQSDEFVASSGQVSFNTSVPYQSGHLFVYRNGILLEKSEYSANGGTLVTITSGVPANDIIVLQYSGGAVTNTSTLWLLANSVINGTAVVEQINLPEANLSSNLIVTSTNTANQVLDLFSTTDFRSVKYLVQVTSGSDYQVSELMLLHNDSNSYITEYGLITTNSSLMTYDSEISSGNVRLLMTPINNVNSVKIVRTTVTV